MTTLVSISNMNLENKSTASSWFVFILGKVGFYNKLGVFFWSLFAAALQGLDIATYDHFVGTDNWDASTMVELVTFMVYLSMLFLTPTAIYKVHINCKIILNGKKLRAPPYPILLLLLGFLNMVSLISVWFSQDLKFNSTDDFLFAIMRSILDFLSFVLLLLPNLLTGILTSTFKHQCHHFRNITTIEPKTEARRMLMEFRSIKEGCQIFLFFMFVGNTLLCIGVSYLIAMYINGCLKDSQTGATYLMFVLIHSLCLVYYGFTFEDCFEELKKIADTLRYLFKNLTQKGEKRKEFQPNSKYILSKRGHS